MTFSYRTVVLHLPATPLGLLPERWTTQHWCNLCHDRVAPEQLIAHVQGHDRFFQSPQTSGTIAPTPTGSDRGDASPRDSECDDQRPTEGRCA